MDRIDLSKLTPAPWRAERRFSNGCEIVPRIHCEKSTDRECGWIADCVGAPYLGYESTLVNAEFIALARNAFDVMMRRLRQGWEIYVHAGYSHKKKMVAEVFLFRQIMHGVERKGEPIPFGIQFDFLWTDPYVAFVEADKWYRENVEANRGKT